MAGRRSRYCFCTGAETPHHPTKPTTMTATATATAAQQITVGAYLEIDFPALNKNDTLDRNDQEIERKAHRTRCRVDRVVELSLADFCDVARSLMNDRDLWGKIGGQDLSPLDREAFGVLCRQHDADVDKWETWAGNPELMAWFRLYSFTSVVAVTCQGQRPFFVNTEGYGYARYVGRAA